ncbi:MAG: hypothetical protein WDW36_007758 [Sanguina aurantia]
MSKLAVDVRVAAVAMETVLPEAEDPSLLLTRGRTILARERGTRSMLHDLYWFYRHAAGEDIMLPALVDALCYGLIQLSDDAGNALVCALTYSLHAYILIGALHTTPHVYITRRWSHL